MKAKVTLVVDELSSLRQLYLSTGSPIAKEIVITPALAEHLLENNPNNRKVSQRTVGIIANDIRSGRWAVNGETIIIADDGTLNDGQHRLWAIIESGISVSSMIVYGVPRKTKETIDIGRQRTTGDFIGMAGETHANVSAALAGHLLRWEKGIAREKSTTIGDSKTEILTYFNEHKTEIQSAIAKVTSNATKFNRAGFGGPAFIAFTWTILGRKAGEATADDFWHQMLTGSNLSENSPILYARNRMMRDKKMGFFGRLELLFRAWNAWREGRTVATLPVNGDIPNLV